MTEHRTAATAVPLHPLLAQRWSPRAFDVTAPVTDAQVTALLEAARWSPSTANGQPWRFVVGRPGDVAHKEIVESLLPGNRAWASDAPLLIATFAQVVRDDGTEHGLALYDLGLAVSLLTVQAHAEGLHVHQMGGFDAAALASALGAPDGFRAVTVIAAGRLGDPASLPEPFRSRETAPRARRELAEQVFSHVWGEPAPLLA